ncbi:MAG: hypothetical protein EXR05_10750 [Acetobacteraceae bacterium]|nr:hypothetical protein [Acetobacteraceae bacterium]MSP29739.1 hypothetical protein [Acetobacteraceae bacterium]
MSEHDHPEANELEHPAAWRRCHVDTEPADTSSAATARYLQQRAAELRTIPDAAKGAALLRKYRCLCN